MLMFFQAATHFYTFGELLVYIYRHTQSDREIERERYRHLVSPTPWSFLDSVGKHDDVEHKLGEAALDKETTHSTGPISLSDLGAYCGSRAHCRSKATSCCPQVNHCREELSGGSLCGKLTVRGHMCSHFADKFLISMTCGVQQHTAEYKDMISG